MNVSPLGLAAAALPAGVAAQRVPVSSGQLLTACRLAWEQDGRLVALWASDERDRHRGFCVRAVLEDREGLTLLEHQLPHPDSHYPDLTPIFPAANRMQRAAFDLVGIASDADDQRPWAWMASWPIDHFPLRRDFVALAEVGAGARGLRVRPRRRRRCARDSRGSGARRDHRARTLPLPGRRREGAPAGRAAGLRPQGHRKAVRVDAARRGVPAGRSHLRRFDGRVRASRMRRPRRRSSASPRRRAPRGCGRWHSSASASPITWATSAISATTADSRSGSRNSRD